MLPTPPPPRLSVDVVSASAVNAPTWLPTPPACASFPLICWQCVPYSSRQSCLLFYILIFSLFRFHSFCSLNSRLVSCLHSTLSAACGLFACLSGTGYCILVTIYISHLAYGALCHLAFGSWPGLDVFARSHQSQRNTLCAARCTLIVSAFQISYFMFHISRIAIDFICSRAEPRVFSI